MNNEEMFCLRCGKKLRYRATWDNYVCGECNILYDENLREVDWIGDTDPLRVSRDKDGNFYIAKEERKDNKIIYTQIYFLEPSKITLRGEYPKLKEGSKCKYPKRLSCNYGTGFERCEFMEYGGTLGNWICKYRKSKK